MRTGNPSYCLPNRKRLVPFPALRTAYLLVAKLRIILQMSKIKEVDEQAVLFQKAGETKAPSYEERALRDAKKQILLNGLNKASETILNESHNITANGIAHAFKNHGVNGNKLNNNSFPLRKEDAALIL